MERRAWQSLVFPAIIVTALIWLGISTLSGGSGDKHRIRWSDALALVRHSPGGIESATFRSSSHEIELRLSSGKRDKATYPVDQSAWAMQQLLEQKGIPFDAKHSGASAWWSILTSLLPFVLLFGFWIFLMRTVGSNRLRGQGSPETTTRG